MKNSAGQLPFHVACNATDDLRVLRKVIEVNPEVRTYEGLLLFGCIVL